MKNIKAFLFANIPLSAVHFVLLLIARSQGWRELRNLLGQPGYWVCDLLGVSAGGFLWWVVLVINSLVWGGAISLFVLPAIKKFMK